MIPPINTRVQVTITTVKMVPSIMDESDLKMGPEEFARFTKYNQEAEQEKLFMHKAYMVVEVKDGESMQGAMQGAVFNIDRGNGRQELRELLDAVRQATLERLYPAEETPLVVSGKN